MRSEARSCNQTADRRKVERDTKYHSSSHVWPSWVVQMSEIAWAGCEPTIVVANVALRVLAGRGAANDLQPLSFFIASIASKTCWW